MSAIGGFGGNDPIRRFEVKDEFKNKPDEVYVKNALAGAKSGNFAEAAALVKEIKNEELKNDTMSKIFAIIEELNKTNPNSAYDAGHQFLENIIFNQ